MFYHEHDGAFLIKGIFRSTRGEEALENVPRPYTSIAYREVGVSNFNVNGEIMCAESGSITYIPRGVGFYRQSTAEELIVLHLMPVGETDASFGVITDMEGTRHLFEGMADEWADKTAGYENRCYALLHTVFAQIEKSKQNVHPKAALIREGAMLIEKRCHDADFSVSEAASVCHISEVYFRKLYKEIYGMTPIRALTLLRIERAKTYLLDGRHNVSETASLCGFDDVKYFSTVFRAFTGMPPSSFAAMG